MHPRSRAAHRHRRGRHSVPERAERVLDRSELQLLLLTLFDDGAMHGYELIRKIKSISRGAYGPSPGMVYPALADMAKDALLEKVAEEAGRKTYRITPEGRAAAAESQAVVEEITARLENLGRVEADFQAPIRRAVSNLELVLANVAPEAGGDRVDRIVTIIDEAARSIERLD